MAVRERKWYRLNDLKAEGQRLALEEGRPETDWKSLRAEAWASLKAQSVPMQKVWVCEYRDGNGIRVQKPFKYKKDAVAHLATVTVEVREGIHVADSATVTLKDAGELWLKSREALGRQRTTMVQYREHLDLHITPFIGRMLLSKLTAPAVRAFEDRLRDEGRSDAMIRKIMVSLSSLLSDAGERGLVARNVVRDLLRNRGKGKDSSERRKDRRLKAGIDFPTTGEIRAIIEHVEGRWRPIIVTAILTGMRASELRGLRWEDIDFEKGEIHVSQRVDRFHTVDLPKSRAGQRTIPVPPLVLNTLKEWRLQCPKRDTGIRDADRQPVKKLHFVFPNGNGNDENLSNITKRGLIPAQVAAGVVDASGKAKYGMHALRHFYASWCINRLVDGGCGLPPKVVQERLGHATFAMTMDVYGHLFPRGDDSRELATAEKALLG